MPKKISLKQFLMRTGIFEKMYDCMQAAKDGRVTINNKAVINPNYFFNPKKSLVIFDGKKLNPAANLYFLMNKPLGLICQKSSSEKNIYDLIKKLGLPKEQTLSLFAVGRLDKETEGLIIITNDGKISKFVSEPKNEIKKEYYAKLQNPISAQEIKKLEQGIKIDVNRKSYTTMPSKISAIGEKELHIAIFEGKKRQVRKMFENLGNEVVHLKRISIGKLSLGNLKTGGFKEIGREEIIEGLEY